MNVQQRMVRLGLMASYASKAAHDEGRKQLHASKIYQPLLKSILLSTNGADCDDCEPVSWSTCTRLDKIIDGREIHVTLVEWSEVESSPEYSWYESKSDMDKCSAIVNLKRKFRDMIRNPEKYISVDY